MSTITRNDRIASLLDELDALDTALNKQPDGCLLAYAIYTDFAGDLLGEELTEEDKKTAYDLYLEVVNDYILVESEHMFTLIW